ncbi:MAG: cyclase family protein [Methanomicrobiales archaeon]|nr:cyclase family protein [Methanomicrobiales archaeon]
MIRISRPLRVDSPLYPGTPPPSMVTFRSLEMGDSSGSSLITVHSHSGTHLDAPRHFCPGGAATDQVCGGELVLAPALCMDLPRTGDHRIGPADLREAGRDLRGVRALLIRTGSARPSDPGRSATGYPWIDPSVPPFLREECPTLRLLGVDTLSIASPLHREEGRACHRAFLCGSPPVLLLEDLDLAPVTGPGWIWRLRIIPWLHAPLDGVPVTAFLEDTGGFPAP